jgi:hypothetical protein
MSDPKRLRTQATKLMHLAAEVRQRGQWDFADLLTARANKYFAELAALEHQSPTRQQQQAQPEDSKED